MTIEGEIATARLIRLATIRSALASGDITFSQAVELLQGPLAPGDESTAYDDSELLNADPLLIVATVLGGKPNA